MRHWRPSARAPCAHLRIGSSSCLSSCHFVDYASPVSSLTIISMPPNDFITALARVFPRDRLLVQAGELVPYESDALTAFHARPAAVVIPETQAEVIEAVKICHQFAVPFVARGSGTSLSG